MNADKIKELRELVATLDVPLRASCSWLRTNSGTKLAGVGEGQMSVEDATDIVAAVNSLPAILDEVEALTADAERYRWLRNPESRPALVLDKVTGYVEYHEGTRTGGYSTYEYRCGEELDTAIDAARHEPKDAE